VTTTLQDN